MLAGVPRIVDVEIMAEVLAAIGARVDRGPDAPDGGPGDLVIDTPATLVPEAPYELVEKMRASVVVLGPLLARTGRASVSLPGGDDFGNRPIDIHLHGLSTLGAVFETVHGNIEGARARRCARAVSSASASSSSTRATPPPTTCSWRRSWPRGPPSSRTRHASPRSRTSPTS